MDSSSSGLSKASRSMPPELALVPLGCKAQRACEHTHLSKVGHNHIYIYIRCIYGILGRDLIKYTVIYGTYIIYIYMVLIKPTFVMPELQRCHGVHLAKWDLCYDLCQPRALCVNCVSHVH